VTRTCPQCERTFEPKRPHQEYDDQRCQYQGWIEKGVEEAAQCVEGGVGTRGGNVRSVQEARDLQTASKQLDRWRLAMEVQAHRTLIQTGHFHVDDLDALNLPPEAFGVRGTLVNSIRCTGVMESTGVYRKVAHAAANARKAPIYRITETGRQELPKLAGMGGTGNEGPAPSDPGESADPIAPLARPQKPEDVSGVGASPDLSRARSSTEEQRTSKPRVAGSNPAGRAQQQRGVTSRSTSEHTTGEAASVRAVAPVDVDESGGKSEVPAAAADPLRLFSEPPKLTDPDQRRAA
jgi:hypothetical protein